MSVVHDIPARRMLTLTLRNLERDGLVRRTVYPVVPARVDYELTAPGMSLLTAVEPLRAWVRAYHDGVAAARASYDNTVNTTELVTGGMSPGNRVLLNAQMLESLAACECYERPEVSGRICCLKCCDVAAAQLACLGE
jgi:HxlR-like helix-turn-helix